MHNWVMSSCISALQDWYCNLLSINLPRPQTEVPVLNSYSSGHYSNAVPMNPVIHMLQCFFHLPSQIDLPPIHSLFFTHLAQVHNPSVLTLYYAIPIFIIWPCTIQWPLMGLSNVSYFVIIRCHLRFRSYIQFEYTMPISIPYTVFPAVAPIHPTPT